jgi:hypothetical protein
VPLFFPPALFFVTRGPRGKSLIEDLDMVLVPETGDQQQAEPVEVSRILILCRIFVVRKNNAESSQVAFCNLEV